MRIVLLLLVAMLAIKSSSAFGQDACTQGYVTCVDRCVASPAKSLHDRCIETCQGRNNQCFAQQAGPPQAQRTAAPVPADSNDALADADKAGKTSAGKAKGGKRENAAR